MLRDVTKKEGRQALNVVRERRIESNKMQQAVTKTCVLNGSSSTYYHLVEVSKIRRTVNSESVSESFSHSTQC